MQPDRLVLIERLFHEAEERHGEARASFLDEACDGDIGLRREVEALLRSAAVQSGALISPIAAVSNDILTGGHYEPGARIGPYEIIRLIGSGGMGAVYLVRRADAEYHQMVALKVIRSGMYQPEVVRRFRVERQILANLVHPNIARLLDGGITDQGSPYLVMEYVDGLPILDYCARHQPGIAQRLDMFRQVCNGVQCAHQNLVVHRDIKPANILVAADGTPKLLDFGIAKMLSPEPVTGEQEALTAYTERLMTPEYASPEQIRGEAVTTANDVYSLGVVLYELLTGRRAFRITKKSASDIERLICESEPPKPSGVAENAALRRDIDGDLDNIVLKAIHKDSSRRYPSAHEMAEDVGRHLRGYPVLARGDDWPYRARKFIRRNRWPLTLAGVAAGLIVSFGIGMAVLARHAGEQRDQAEEVLAFMIGAFEQADPDKVAGKKPPTAREIIDQGVRGAGKLANRPAVQVRLLESFGEVYERIGEWKLSGDLLRRALDIRRTLHGETDPLFGDALKRMTELERRLGNTESAAKLGAQLIGLRERILAPGHPKLAEARNTYALVLHEQGKLKEAEALFASALTTRDRLGSMPHLETAILSNLGGVNATMGDFDKAERYFRECLEIRRKTLGDTHTRIALVMGRLAAVLHGAGRLDEAETMARDSAAMYIKLYGHSNPEVNQSYVTLAEIRMERGDFDGAEEWIRRAADVYRQRGGVDPAGAAAALEEQRGKFKDAERLYRAQVERLGKVERRNHHGYGPARAGLGRVLLAQGRIAEAEHEITEGVRVVLASLPPDSLGAARATASQASLEAARSRLTEAEALYRSSL